MYQMPAPCHQLRNTGGTVAALAAHARLLLSFAFRTQRNGNKNFLYIFYFVYYSGFVRPLNV